MRFEREVSGINKLNCGLWKVLLKGFRACRYKEGVVLAPDCKERRLMCPEVLVELRINRYIVAVVEVQIELDVDIPGTLNERDIEGVALWRDAVWFRHTGKVLKSNSIRPKKSSNHVAVLSGVFLPPLLK